MSVVIPCRNEVGHIVECLDSLLAVDYPRDRLEVVIADGMSDDGTRDIIAGYVAEHPSITMIDNPRRITPCAMNAAIRAARGEVIIRMDAHAFYPSDYCRRLIEAQRETGADNVGTVIETLPADDTLVAAAVAVGLSHRLGVGNSHFRVGTARRKWVNHVPFGCWRREVFERIGLFDEDLPRDQDVEFNGRLLNHGGRILLLPDVVSRYRGRRTIGQLARMMYQYGYFKPLVARKNGAILTVRQLVPSLFVLALGGAMILAPWWSPARIGLGLLVAAYGLLIGVATLRSLKRCGSRAAPALVVVFPAMHLSYGVGYLRGIVDHVVRSRSVARAATEVALSR